MTINVRATLGLCVALFGLKVCGINISMEGLGTITPDLNGRNLLGERSYTITARPRAGFTFDGWSVWDPYGVDTEFHSPTLNITLVDGQLYVRRGTNYESAGSFDAYFTAHFTPKNIVPGTYRGFNTETATIYTTLRVSASGAFSGKTFFQGTWHRFSGKLSGAGDGHTTIQIGSENVGVMFVCNGNGGPSVYAQTDPYDPDSVLNWLTADLVMQKHDPGIASHYGGKYTMTITGEDNDASVPKGDGFAIVSVNSAGQLFAVGKLADGTPFTQSVLLSGPSPFEWPFFLLLKGGTETLGGSVQFITNPAYLAGLVAWEKNPETNGVNYPVGFRDYLVVNGSPYVPPKLQRNQILDTTNLVVSFDGGTLPIHFAATGTLSSNGRIVMDDPTNQVTLAINPKNGLFIGDAIPPGQSEPIHFEGVVAQALATHGDVFGYYGSGFFLKDNLSGRVKIEAPQ